MLAAACSGSGDAPRGGGDRESLATAMSATDEHHIAELVYDPGYSTPAGFYVDDRAATDRSYSLHHVLDASGSYEVCTDDYAVARQWEEADNVSRAVSGYLVESRDTARYFEFSRELSYDNDIGNVDELTSPGFARVFKCRDTNRDGVDRTMLSGFAGAINARPLTAAIVREFTEYLWQFTFFPASRKKVLDSFSTPTDNGFTQTLVVALATRQGYDRCDLVEIAHWLQPGRKPAWRASLAMEPTGRWPPRAAGAGMDGAGKAAPLPGRKGGRLRPGWPLVRPACPRLPHRFPSTRRLACPATCAPAHC